MRISDWSSDVCSSDLAFARCSILFRTKPQRITQKSFALSLSKGRSSFFRRRKKGQCFDKLSTNGLNKPHFVASRLRANDLNRGSIGASTRPLHVAALRRDMHRQPVQVLSQHDLARQAAGAARAGGEVEHVLFLFAGGR